MFLVDLHKYQTQAAKLKYLSCLNKGFVLYCIVKGCTDFTRICLGANTSIHVGDIFDVWKKVNWP